MAATSPAPNKALRLLCLGDSYTIGECVAVSERWPVQLAALLEAEGHTTTVKIIAQTGWTTDELSAAIDRAESTEELQAPYDFVSLLIGVNNQYRARPATSYTPEFTKLLNRSIEFAGSIPRRVVVISIPDWGRTPFAQQDARDSMQISAELDQYNEIARTLSTQAGCHFVAITALSREAFALHPGWLAEDGLHPGPMAYQQWAAQVASVLLAQLDHSSS